MNIESYIDPHNLAALPEGIIFIGFILLVWGGILQLIAFASGWKKLYKQLGSHSSPQVIGESSPIFRFQTGRFNHAQYKGCLNVKTTRYALIIKMIAPLAFGHKPLVIPWEKIDSLQPENFLFYRSVVINLKAPLNAKITLPEKIFLDNPHLPSNIALTSPNQKHENPYQ